MLIRYILLVSMLVFVPATMAADNAQSAATSDAQVKQELTLTPSQLAAFNGQNGAKAYIAVDGIIYDVTNVKAWKGGKHHGGKAGTDVSKLIMKSPHKKSVLKKLTAVGKLVPEPESSSK